MAIMHVKQDKRLVGTHLKEIYQLKGLIKFSPGGESRQQARVQKNPNNKGTKST